MKRKNIIVVLMLVVITTATGCSNNKQAKTYYKTGIECFEQGNYEEAKKNLAQAVEQNPQKAEYYIDYGYSLIKTGEYNEALVQFNKAINEKDTKVARENNKRAHRGKGITYYESSDYENAVKEFDAALKLKELDDMNKDLLYYKASAEDKYGNYQDALFTYQQIEKDYKADAFLNASIAEIEYRLGETKKAIEYYDKAIAQNPDVYDYYFGKYAILVAAQNEADAKKVLEKALAIKAKTDQDRYNVAKLHYFSKDTDKAEQELKAAADKDFSEAYFYLGEIAYQKKDYESAVASYEKYMELEPGSKITAVYNQIGSAYMQIKEYKKALDNFRAGIEKNDAGLLQKLKFNEIAALEKMAEFKEAYEKAQEYIKIYPDDANMKREITFLKTRVEQPETEKSKTNNAAKADTDTNNTGSGKSESDKTKKES